jgi:hypothetical protein
MVDKDFIGAVPSFMIECAVYNIDDYRFDNPSNFINCLHVLEDMAEAADDPATYSEWEEVNGLKYLFRPSQAWTIDDMRRLVDRSVKYLEAG